MSSIPYKLFSTWQYSHLTCCNTLNMYTDVNNKENTFTDFYRQSAMIHDNDPMCRQDFPRLDNTGIDDFDYYTDVKFQDSFKYNKNNLSIFNVNIRGISCNFDNLTMYLNSLNFTFDAIVLSECHIQKDLANVDLHNKYPITGYNLFYVKSNISYGGVMVYILDLHEASYHSKLTQSNNVMDSCYVKIHNSKINDTVYIGGYYRFCNPGKDEILSFISHIDNHLSSKELTKNNTIISGDFNICLMKSTYNDESNSFLNTLIQNGYECHIFKPTRIQHYKDSLQIRSMTLIDQISSKLVPTL